MEAAQELKCDSECSDHNYQLRVHSPKDKSDNDSMLHDLSSEKKKLKHPCNKEPNFPFHEYKHEGTALFRQIYEIAHPEEDFEKRIQE